MSSVFRAMFAVRRSVSLFKVYQCVPLSSVSNDPKPFSDIPRKPPLPIFGRSLDYMGSSVRDKPYKTFFSRYNELGPIFRERAVITVPEMLIVCDPNDIETVFRADGKWGQRLPIDVWEKVRHENNIPWGVFLTNKYDDWHRQRQPMSKFMMIPRKVGEYHAVFNEITEDLIKGVRQLKDPQTNTLLNVPELLRKWSFESVSYFVLGRRMGCLDIGNTPEDCQEFIDAIDGFLVASHDLLFNLPFYKLYRTKLWKKLEHYQMRSFEIATKFIEEKIKDLNENFELSSDLSDDVPVNVDFLTYMLLGKQMSIQETSINAIDLLGAGVDTTSYTLGWSLYALATNTEVQSKLREEVNRVTKDDNVITPEHIHNMPYLRHTIREAQRLYPLAPNNARILAKDVVLSGYHVPKGTHVVMPIYIIGRLPHLFPEPEVFNPDRWDRSEHNINQYASLPFGFGPRMCVGRRVAELELHIALAHFMKRFTIEFTEATPIEAMQKLFTVPDRQMNLVFRDI